MVARLSLLPFFHRFLPIISCRLSFLSYLLLNFNSSELSLVTVRADLPVSCYQWDIIGEWDFTFGVYDGLNCGVQSPDKPGSHEHITPGPPLESVEDKSAYGLGDKWKPEGSFRAFVSQNHVHVQELNALMESSLNPGVKTTKSEKRKPLDKSIADKYGLESGSHGMWSMVYNQGFYMNLQGSDPKSPIHSFYAVSQYVKTPGLDVFGSDVAKNRAASQCDYTLLGQYSIVNSAKLGQPFLAPKPGQSFCYWGKQIGPLPTDWVQQVPGPKPTDILQTHLAGQATAIARMKEQQQHLETSIRNEAAKGSVTKTDASKDGTTTTGPGSTDSEKKMKDLNEKLVALQGTMTTTQKLYEDNLRLQAAHQKSSGKLSIFNFIPSPDSPRKVTGFERILLLFLPVMLVVSPIILFIGLWKYGDEYWHKNQQIDRDESDDYLNNRDNRGRPLHHETRAEQRASLMHGRSPSAGSQPGQAGEGTVISRMESYGATQTDDSEDTESYALGGSKTSKKGVDWSWGPRILIGVGVASIALSVGLLYYEMQQPVPQVDGPESKYISKIHDIQREMDDVEHQISDISRTTGIAVPHTDTTTTKKITSTSTGTEAVESKDSTQTKPVTGPVTQKTAVPDETALNNAETSVSIKEVHDHITDQHEKLQEIGHKVRFKIMEKDELHKYLEERSKVMPVGLTEHSDMVKLVDAKNKDGDFMNEGIVFPGFSSSQSTGMVDDAENPDLISLSEKLQVNEEQLTQDEIASLWGPRVADLVHHADPDRTFHLEVNGKRHLLGPDDWRNGDKYFDWRKTIITHKGVEYKDITIAAMQQGACGNCYAAAASNMYTTRLMLKYPELHKDWRDRSKRMKMVDAPASSKTSDGTPTAPVFISVDQQTACNWLNQGCEGGYPVLSHMWASEHDLVTNKCWQSLTADNAEKCAMIRRHEDQVISPDECKDQHFRVLQYRYIGTVLGRCAFYGMCEQLIREEVYHGGPITTAMEPRGNDYSNFQYYKGGILHEVPEVEAEEGELVKTYPEKDNIACKRTTCYTFRKLDHALLVVGWGADKSETGCYYREGKNTGTHECEKQSKDTCELHGPCKWGGYPFWIFQNSWGTTYGEHGFIRIGPRGGNPFHLESMATSADLVMVSKSFVDTKEEGIVTGTVNTDSLTKAHGENAIVSSTSSEEMR